MGLLLTIRRQNRQSNPNSVRTLAQAIAGFLSFNSSVAMFIGVVVALVVRLAAAGNGVPFSSFDLVAVAAVAIAAPFVEWGIHKHLLHHEPYYVNGKLVDTSLGHLTHHRETDSLASVLLIAPAATAMQIGGALLATAVIAPPLAVVNALNGGTPILGPVLTGALAATLGALHYEWAHFLFHTSYRPRLARYRRLKANHRRHHWRNDDHWLGVTSNLGDRFFGTLPQSPGDVPHQSIRRRQQAAGQPTG